jgi:hypothetical protein
VTRSSIPGRLREQVLARDAGRGAWCRLLQLGQGATFHVDHVRPRSKGGATVLENLALQCPSCSLHKADKIEARDPVTGEIVRLFDPLDDAWIDHFKLEDDGTCVGLTAIGRATVEGLEMNLPIPRIARGAQIALGLIRIEGVPDASPS